MRLSRETQQELEDFLRVYFHEPQLRLPRVKVYGGWLGRIVTRVLNIGAITFGRHIIIAPSLMRRDAAGRITIPGWLLAHECTHVMQYRQAGWRVFLVSYLGEYFRTLRRGGRFGAGARNAAYRAISYEREARAAEEEYADWRAQMAEPCFAEEVGKEPAATPRDA